MKATHRWAPCPTTVLGIPALLLSFVFFGPAALKAAQEAGAWTAPRRAAKKKNPVPADKTSINRGKKLYKRKCLSCHGLTGKGNGPSAADLAVPPGNLSDPKMSEQSDGALFWKITEGREPMPSYKQLFTDEQRWQLVNYIRTFAPERDCR